MKKNKMRSFLVALFSLINLIGFSQDIDVILDGYIQQGIESNLVVQQKNVSYERAMYALDEAKFLFIPNLDFQAIYTTAKGGRSYEIPVGDYINPMLGMINDFLGPNTVELLENEKINFLPTNYYDARFRFSVPILNMDIVHNMNIRKRQVAISEFELDMYERELVKEIKITYYNYLSVIKAIEIHENALSLAEESKRTNEKLVEAGNGLYAYVLRSETEIEKHKADLKAMILQAKTLKRYFNALLNRDAEEIILIPSVVKIIPFYEDIDYSAVNREELYSLDQAIALREDMLKMEKQAFIPKLGGFFDLGSQAEHMKINRESLYYMVGVQLDIPIFHGLRNNRKIRQANKDVEFMKLQRADVEQKLNVSVSMAYNEVLEQQSNYEATLKQVDLAETYYRLINKGYESGVNTYLETVDARTQLSSARLAMNISYYKLLSAIAKFERETASYPLPNK